VWFVARRWVNDPRRYARFDEMSSPTAVRSRAAPPGNYFHVAWRGDRRGRQPIVVGGHGRSQQTIDLPLR
jgi:hypothetical protein